VEVEKYETPEHIEYDDTKAELGGEVTGIDAGFEPAMLKRLVRRIDFRLIPILSLMYLISIVDRTNLAIARAANNVYMDKELHLKVGDRYSIITCIFFVPYILFELPVSPPRSFVGASVSIPRCVVVIDVACHIHYTVIKHRYPLCLPAGFDTPIRVPLALTLPSPRSGFASLEHVSGCRERSSAGVR